MPERLHEPFYIYFTLTDFSGLRTGQGTRITETSQLQVTVKKFILLFKYLMYKAWGRQVSLQNTKSNLSGFTL